MIDFKVKNKCKRNSQESKFILSSFLRLKARKKCFKKMIFSVDYSTCTI